MSNRLRVHPLIEGTLAEQQTLWGELLRLDGALGGLVLRVPSGSTTWPDDLDRDGRELYVRDTLGPAISAAEAGTFGWPNADGVVLFDHRPPAEPQNGRETPYVDRAIYSTRDRQFHQHAVSVLRSRLQVASLVGSFAIPRVPRRAELEYADNAGRTSIGQLAARSDALFIDLRSSGTDETWAGKDEANRIRTAIATASAALTASGAPSGAEVVPVLSLQTDPDTGSGRVLTRGELHHQVSVCARAERVHRLVLWVDGADAVDVANACPLAGAISNAAGW